MKDIYKQIGIYRITNTVNGKSYIGKTGMNFGDRWDCHRALLRAGKHDNPYLQNAWSKYGEQCFEFAVVQIVEQADDLNDLEVQYIAQYRREGKCYNLHDGGDGGYNLGKHLSEDTKRKIGAKNRLNMLGKKASDATKAKMSASQRKRYDNWTPEERVTFGRLVSEKSRGYHWSTESKQAFAKRQQTQPNGAKLNATDVIKIRELAAEGMLRKDLATMYNTTPSYITAIVKRRRWAHI